ncbi:MAG: ParB/RepB/Spo0J family partition protein, partial [Bacilli bacterium]
KLKALVEKYQRNSIVTEIEKNLTSSKVVSFPLDSLYLSDLYCEINYDLNSYTSLEESIKKDGFLMPLIIVKGDKEKTYEIINGAKRFLLAKKANLSPLPGVLVDLTKERKNTYIIENIAAEGDSPLVKTYCFKVLKEKYGYSDQAISEEANISLNQERNLLRLDALPDFLKQGLKDFSLSYGEARALLNLPLEKQQEFYKDITESKMSVRDLERLKRNYNGQNRKTTVRLKGNKIIITFATKEEASKIYPRIDKSLSD